MGEDACNSFILQTSMSTKIYPTRIGTQIVPCSTYDDHLLISQAAAISQMPDEAETLAADQYTRMSEACGRYGLTNLQQMTARLAQRQ
jgi:hypothetical protein